MSYREENGEIVLAMSREDYEHLLITLGYAVGVFLQQGGRAQLRTACALVNRINQGNPGYKPYREDL